MKAQLGLAWFTHQQLDMHIKTYDWQQTYKCELCFMPFCTQGDIKRGDGAIAVGGSGGGGGPATLSLSTAVARLAQKNL